MHVFAEAAFEVVDFGFDFGFEGYHCWDLCALGVYANFDM